MGCRVSGNRDGYIGSIDTAVGYRYRDAVFSVVLHSFSTIISGAVYMKPFKNSEMRLKVDNEGILSAYFKKSLTPDMVISGTASV